MKAVNDIWRQLVGRKLWPLALILVAALVAVPFALAKDADAPEPKLQPVDTAAADATKTIVSVATESGARRHVLGSQSNPFLGQKLPKVKKADEPDGGGDDTDDGVDPDPTTGSGGSTGGTTPSTGGPVTPGTGTPADPTAPVREYERHELTVRFGDASGALERRSVKVGEGLPLEEPVVLYLGLSKDGRSAIFLVEKNVTALGDGDCRPDPESCETVRLKAGETEFFDVTDDAGTVGAQFQLDLVKIHKAGASASAAGLRRAAAGRKLAGARVGSVASASAARLP